MTRCPTCCREDLPVAAGLPAGFEDPCAHVTLDGEPCREFAVLDKFGDPVAVDLTDEEARQLIWDDEALWDLDALGAPPSEKHPQNGDVFPTIVKKSKLRVDVSARSVAPTALPTYVEGRAALLPVGKTASDLAPKPPAMIETPAPAPAKPPAKKRAPKKAPPTDDVDDWQP